MEAGAAFYQVNGRAETHFIAAFPRAGHLSINPELEELGIQVQEEKNDKDLDGKKGGPPLPVPAKERLSPSTAVRLHTLSLPRPCFISRPRDWSPPLPGRRRVIKET